jgi:hypothetical protein
MIFTVASSNKIQGMNSNMDVQITTVMLKFMLHPWRLVQNAGTKYVNKGTSHENDIKHSARLLVIRVV